MFYIYKMIHLPSGRIYIGQRKVPKGKTLETDNYFGSGTIWRRIYNKHKDECVKVIIDTASSKEEIDKLEKKYIAHYKNVYGEFCVNIAEGGDGGYTGPGYWLGKKMPREIVEKCAAKKRGKKAWNKGLTMTHEQKKNMLGRKPSDEARAKMSESARNRKPMSEETKKKISDARKKYIKENPDKLVEYAKKALNTRRKDPDKLAESYKKAWNTRRKENA